MERGMMRVMNTAFNVTYDGPALDTHQMDVRELAPALLGLADVLDRASAFTHGTGAVELKIDATRGGSFAVDLVVSFYDSAVDLLSSNEAQAGAAATAYAGALVVSMKFAIRICKLMARLGRPVDIARLDQSEPAANGAGAPAVEITWADGTRMVASEAAWKITQDAKAMRGLQAMAKPLEKGRVETFSVDYNGDVERVTAEERDAFVHDETEDLLGSNTLNVTVWPDVTAWTGDRRWRVTDGQGKFSAAIEDRDFLDAVGAGSVRIGALDSFYVRMRYEQILRNGKPAMDHIIEQVLRHDKHEPHPAFDTP